jgi:hypothetical protein
MPALIIASVVTPTAADSLRPLDRTGLIATIVLPVLVIGATMNGLSRLVAGKSWHLASLAEPSCTVAVAADRQNHFNRMAGQRSGNPGEGRRLTGRLRPDWFIQ